MKNDEYTAAKEEWETAVKNKEDPNFMIFQKLHEIVTCLEEIDSTIYHLFKSVAITVALT
jgi:hypothetical protein